MKKESNNPSNYLRERGNIDVVLLAVIGQDEILESDFAFDPFLVTQRRPNMMGFLTDGKRKDSFAYCSFGLPIRILQGDFGMNHCLRCINRIYGLLLKNA